MDDYAVDSNLRDDRSVSFEVRVENGEISELRLLPTEIDSFAVLGASTAAAEWSRTRMRMLSEPFGTEFEVGCDELVLRPRSR